MSDVAVDGKKFTPKSPPTATTSESPKVDLIRLTLLATLRFKISCRTSSKALLIGRTDARVVCSFVFARPFSN